jgi:GNAT superfamily N-acetyltransferase
MEKRRDDGYEISDDRARVDLDVVHGFLVNAYWCAGIPRDTVARAIESSLVLGVYRGAEQVAFARVITDYTTFAYLCDVFVLESARGRGLGKWIAQTIVEHPRLQGLRRFVLITRDAHGLYAKHGFKPLKSAERYMERHDPDVYRR